MFAVGVQHVETFAHAEAVLVHQQPYGPLGGGVVGAFAGVGLDENNIAGGAYRCGHWHAADGGDIPPVDFAAERSDSAAEYG